VLSRLRRTDSGLSDVQQDVLARLQRDGVATVPFAELVGDSALWNELSDDVGEFVASTERMLSNPTGDGTGVDSVKSFIVRRFNKGEGGEDFVLRASDPLLRFGVATELLAVLNAYRGTPVWLLEPNLWYTVPNPNAPERVSSQQWHRDGRENHILKVFTYHSDVDEGAGPFQYVLGSAEGRKYGDLYPWEKREVYPPPDELMAAVDADDVVSLTGTPGTMVICDTSGFHRGGFARTNARVMTVHTYVSDQARSARKWRIDWDADAESFPQLARDALA
jgi:hypothetical protein